MSTRILLVDDHQVLREGLRALLKGEPTLKIVGEADNGRTAVELARKLSPDVIIMDATMPELNGALATQQIRSDCPKAKVIALSMHSDRQYVCDMLNAGASAYLLKTCDLEELLHAINIVSSGRSYLSPDVTEEVVDYYAQDDRSPNRSISQKLSNREQQVLQLLAEGKTSKEIARSLYLSVKTVTAHRQSIMDKLDIRSVAELTKYAIRQGLTSL